MGTDANATLVESVLGSRPLTHGYDSVSVRSIGDRLELRLRITRGDETLGLRIPGPLSSDPQPWVYADPEDTRDWASMLGIWLDEELTAGTRHLATELRSGIRFLIVEPYGLRRVDRADHERLLALAPRGWS